jgi:hypothetical protein
LVAAGGGRLSLFEGEQSDPMDSTTSPEPIFRVAVFAAPEDLHDLGQVLTAVLGMQPIDALVVARHAPGILPDQVPPQKAAALVAAINQIGLHAEIVPAGYLPDFEHCETVHHVRNLDAVLQILGLQGEVEASVPWADIELISVGVVPLEVSKHDEAPRLISAARHTTHQPLNVSLPAGPELWIVHRDPLRVLRIDHRRMNYESLGESMTDSATANFRLFLDRLIQHATQAYITPSTRAFLEHGPERLYHFDTPAQLQRDTQFHLLIRLRMEAEKLPGTR